MKFNVQLIGKYFANGGRMLWTPNLPYRIPATVLQILPLVANLWGCRWDKFVLFIFYFRLLFMLFVLFECLCLCVKLYWVLFEINAQGMLGVDSASARPCFDGTTRGLESNFWVVTACGRSYFSIGLCRLHDQKGTKLAQPTPETFPEFSNVPGSGTNDGDRYQAQLRTTA